MNISKIFQLTEEDKAEYKLLINKIDLNDASKIIDMLNSKLDTMTTSKSLNSIETDLIKYVSVLLNIYQTYPDLTDSIKRRIIFANICLLYTSPSPRDRTRSRMPSSA